MLNRRARSGHVLVEFAMILPLVMAFTFGMIELSRLMMLQHTADTAAYEGARAAIVPGAAAADATRVAQALLTAAEIRNATIQIAPRVITEETPLLTVTVSIPVGDNSWIAFFRTGSYEVSSQVTLVCERPAIVTLTGLPDLAAQRGLLGGLLGL